MRETPRNLPNPGLLVYCTGQYGQPLRRLSFHIETTDRAIRVKPRNTISQRLEALNASSGCAGPIAIGSEIIMQVHGLVLGFPLSLDRLGDPRPCDRERYYEMNCRLGSS